MQDGEEKPLLRPFALRRRVQKNDAPTTRYSKAATAAGIALGAFACTVGTVAIGRSYTLSSDPVIESSEAELDLGKPDIAAAQQHLDGAPMGGPMGSSTTSPLIHMSNEYTRASGRDIGEGYYSWNYLVERHRETNIEILDAQDDCE